MNIVEATGHIWLIVKPKSPTRLVMGACKCGASRTMAPRAITGLMRPLRVKGKYHCPLKED